MTGPRRNDIWYHEFWTYAPEDDVDDHAASAIRIIGELFDEMVVTRHGDNVSDMGGSLTLTADDQYLVRRIQDAAAAARKAQDEDEAGS